MKLKNGTEKPSSMSAMIRQTISPRHTFYQDEEGKAMRNAYWNDKVHTVPKTPLASHLKKHLLLESLINTGEVKRAAYPNYIGATPGFEKDPPIKMSRNMLIKNRMANTRA